MSEEGCHMHFLPGEGAVLSRLSESNETKQVFKETKGCQLDTVRLIRFIRQRLTQSWTLIHMIHYKTIRHTKQTV